MNIYKSHVFGLISFWNYSGLLQLLIGRIAFTYWNGFGFFRNDMKGEMWKKKNISFKPMTKLIQTLNNLFNQSYGMIHPHIHQTIQKIPRNKNCPKFQ